MADIIKNSDLERLVLSAEKLVKDHDFSPIKIIKKIMAIEACSLSEAKEAYLLAANNESLGEYQERVILPILEEFEKHEKLKGNE